MFRRRRDGRLRADAGRARSQVRRGVSLTLALTATAVVAIARLSRAQGWTHTHTVALPAGALTTHAAPTDQAYNGDSDGIALKFHATSSGRVERRPGRNRQRAHPVALGRSPERCGGGVPQGPASMVASTEGSGGAIGLAR